MENKEAKKQNGKLSLQPLTFDEAVKGLLQIKNPQDKGVKKNG